MGIQYVSGMGQPTLWNIWEGDAYGEAVQYKTTQPIPPQENIARTSDVPVWLILLQGNFVEHIPGRLDHLVFPKRTSITIKSL